ncbi:tryptophan synthase subunit beta [Pseudomonas stutzeri]|nr:tryptophan synthase subunit beta [Stutzerimonas stutzeri]
MIYVQRDRQGHLLRVEMEPFEGMSEALPASDAQVQTWLEREETRTRLDRLKASDLELIRVLEDLVAVLVERGVIRYTDLPAAAQRKLQERADARAGLGGLSGLLGDEDESHLI